MIGVAMAGAGGARVAHDFYPTEPAATVALLENHWFFANSEGSRPLIHEPACGDGAISKVLVERNLSVYSTDLIDRGYGISGIDFLQSGTQYPVVITNPPFYLAEEFIRKALECGCAHVFMLLKSTFFHARKRQALFDDTCLRSIMPLTFRLDWTGQGQPTMECSWYHWQQGYDGVPEYGPLLHKPKGFDLVPDRCKNTLDMFEENKDK